MGNFKNIIICLLIGMLFLSACTTAADGDKQIPQGEKQPAETAQVENKYEGRSLTVDIYNDTSLIKSQIANFKKAYPGVELKVNYYGLGTYDKYDKMLQTALMGEGASDVIDISSSMLIECINSPYFADLNDFVENDGYFSDDNFYMNHWEPYMIDGKIKVLTTGVMLNYVGINEKFVEAVTPDYSQYEGVTLNEIGQLYKSVPEGEKQDFYAFPNYNMIFMVEGTTRWYDPLNGVNLFNTPEFIAELEETKSLSDPSMPVDVISSFLINNEYENRYMFTMVSSLYKNVFFPNNDTFLAMKPNREHYFTDFKPYMANEDEIWCAPTNKLGINANSPNKDLAWEFIRFILSEESVNPQNLPPNIDVMATNRKINDWIMYQEFDAMAQRYLGKGIGDLSAEDQQSVENVKLKLRADLARPMRYTYLVQVPAFYDILLKYKDDLITSEQAAEELYNAAYIKMMERQ